MPRPEDEAARKRQPEPEAEVVRQRQPEPEAEVVRRRQRARSRITALLLVAFVVLLYFITIAKTGINWQ